MRINFFEEFPETGVLERGQLINFPSTIFIAARSHQKFLYYREQLSHINPMLEAAYWPLLPKSYWVSPFSYNYELETLRIDLKKWNLRPRPHLKALIDLEIPMRWKLIAKNILDFYENKKLIQLIFSEAAENNVMIYTAEYTSFHPLHQKLINGLGVSYPQTIYPHTKIFMYYTSMIGDRRLYEWKRKSVMQYSQTLGSDVQIGVGTTAQGILRREPIIPPQQLEDDLLFLKTQGITTTVVFRLGGLNSDYLSVLKKFL